MSNKEDVERGMLFVGGELSLAKDKEGEWCKVSLSRIRRQNGDGRVSLIDAVQAGFAGRMTLLDLEVLTAQHGLTLDVFFNEDPQATLFFLRECCRITEEHFEEGYPVTISNPEAISRELVALEVLIGQEQSHVQSYQALPAIVGKVHYLLAETYRHLQCLRDNG